MTRPRPGEASVPRPAPPEPFVIGTSLGLRALVLVSGVLLLAVGIGIAWSEGSLAGKLFLMAFMLGLSGLSFYFAVSGRARLVLDERGLRVRSFGLVEWQDIESASLEKIETNAYLCLKLRDRAKYFGRLPRILRPLWRVDRLAGLGDINVTVTGITADRGWLLDTVIKRLQEAAEERSREPAPPDRTRVQRHELRDGRDRRGRG